MARFTDLLKSFVSPKNEIKTPSFIKTERASTPEPTPPPATNNLKQTPIETIAQAALPPEQVPASKEIQLKDGVEVNIGVQAHADKIDVPVYESDSEWDVVQRSINLFADHANLNREIKDAFVKKWVTELEKAEQKSLYRNAEESDGHLGNKIDRATADDVKGMLGTYQAMIHPGRQARMNDDLKALECIEKFDLGIVDWQLSRDFKMDLITIAIGTIEEQKKAAQNLFEKAQKGQPEAERVYLATKSLASRGEMRLNSAIKTSVIKMDAAKHQLNKQAAEQDNPEIAYESIEIQMPAAAQKNPGKEIAKPKISESNWVDEQALRLFGKI